MFIVSAISTLFLAKEASWGGDRKIKETINFSPRIDIVPSAGRSSKIFKHFKAKRRRKQCKDGSGVHGLLHCSLSLLSFIDYLVS